MREHKQHILYIVIVAILLGLIAINNGSNVSALSYQGSAEINFTFNPTLSVNISSSDLTISNLTPGTASDSNIINVSVATNAAYGYTLSATMNGNNSSLTHTNGTNVFSSIATDSSLPILVTDNTWGYSYKNNLASNPTWSSYSGLSNSVDKVLFNTDSNSNGSIDFKIAAKASETQPSGTYTGTINFTATTKPMPKTIQDIAYMQTFAELDAVDLASVKSSMTLNSAYILKDIRDEKEYYVTRLEDGNVWMTQNLDLDLSHDRPLTSNDTNLNDSTSAAYQDGYTVNNGIVYWAPTNNTITDLDNWSNSDTAPYSYDRGQLYPDADVGYADGHGLAGNYYNWSATIASNNSSYIKKGYASNSICPKGWRLPNTVDKEFGKLLFQYGITKNIDGTGGYADDTSLYKIGLSPMYFIRSGYILNKTLSQSGADGDYWAGTAANVNDGYFLGYTATNITPANYPRRHYGFSVRCLAR